jgi:hypothetical protein
MTGANTWPIVAISYLLVHRNQVAAGEAAELLKSYLRLTMDDTIGGQSAMAPKYGFVPIPPSLRAQNMQAIESIGTARSTKPFVFELTTDTAVGADAHTFSAKRTTHLLRACTAYMCICTSVHLYMHRRSGLSADTYTLQL